MKNKNRHQHQGSSNAQPQSPTTSLTQTTNKNGESASATPQAGIEKSRQSSSALKSQRDKVAALAFQIYEQEGRPEGCSLQHWLKAETQLAAASLQTVKTEVTARTETTVRNEVGTTAKPGEAGVPVPVEFQPQSR